MNKVDRDLANTNGSVAGQLIDYGAKAKKEIILKDILPPRLAQYHIDRRYWIHDLEFFDSTYNCIGIDVASLIGHKKMSLSKAMRKLYREIIRLTNEQSGGIGFIDFDKDMAVYITDESDEEIAEQIDELFSDLNVYVRKGCEKAYITFNFGLDTSENGRRFSRIMLEQYESGDSEGKPYVFPNLVFKLKDGINSKEEDKNYDIFTKACEVTSKCMIPTYFNCDCSINKDANPHSIGIMGCRTRVIDNIFGEKTSLYRGNIACVTINFVQIALESGNNIDKLKEELDKVMEEARKLLIYRFNVLCQNNEFSYLREKNLYLDSEQTNRNMLMNGTLSIGFIGLWDAMEILTNKKMSKEYILKDFSSSAYEIISFMKNKIDKYTEEEKMNFSLLASAAEGVSGNFPKYDKEKYKENEWIADKEYYTNSFHVPVNMDISCVEKIIAEGKYHKLCTGGAITYVELKEVPVGNLEGIRDIILFAKEQDCSYFGINFPLDVCEECGFKGMIGKTCPKCGGNKILKLRRVSGYLSDSCKFTHGKYAELMERKANKI